MRVRRNVTLQPEAAAALQRVGNFSDYTNALILDHARQWTEALAVLHERGWHSEELLAACDGLAGYAKSIASAGGAFLADELERLEELHRYFALREISAQRRTRCFEQVRAEPLVAYAVLLIVREFWLENEDCRHAIRKLSRRS